MQSEEGRGKMSIMRTTLVVLGVAVAVGVAYKVYKKLVTNNG
jgi:hypothetical protein